MTFTKLSTFGVNRVNGVFGNGVTCMYSAMVNMELFEWIACMIYRVSGNIKHFRY